MERSSRPFFPDAEIKLDSGGFKTAPPPSIPSMVHQQMEKNRPGETSCGVAEGKKRSGAVQARSFACFLDFLLPRT
jgi:hypothetical protein